MDMDSSAKSVKSASVGVYYGDHLARYGFGHGHPFATNRLDAFWNRLRQTSLADQVRSLESVAATRAQIESFHTTEYVDRVVEQSEIGHGFLDYGDTPAFPGVYEASAHVVGSTLDAVERVLYGDICRAFVPIAGLHHARRSGAGGFCVFNDCGVAIELLRSQHGCHRIAYVDIDAHHGDGVFYGFEHDPEVFIADIHEDGRFLYPGTGSSDETGKGNAAGTKINLPLLPGAGDDEFFQAWDLAEKHIRAAEPEFILLQCGADGHAEDPLTHLRYTLSAHHRATEQICMLADNICGGRIVAMGGGGYNLDAMASAWCEVVRVFAKNESSG